ncbi:MAG: DUF5060 domain-containing protein [Chloroflexi bacterium]|nr:DUF5060 domain-containing protein [Chloroflexota bacterium]
MLSRSLRHSWLAGAAVLFPIGIVRPSQPAAAAAAPIATPYTQRGPLEIRNVSLPSPAPFQFGRIEFTVLLSATYDNPFDPADVTLDAQVTAPSGKTLSAPGFWYRPFERALQGGREKLTAQADPSWRIRFCPAEAGEHRMALVLRDRTGKVEKTGGVFTVKAVPQAPGFVRISPRDRRYFEFDNGRSYFPVGANVCWGGGRGTFDYDDWFPAYAQAGCNYARLWLSPNWTTFALERAGQAAEGLGLGQFDLANAWRIDHVLELAETNGLHVMLCIDSFNILREKTSYPQWENTPHNAVHGGPLNRPAEFFTNAEMDRFYRNKLRYLVARYGAFTHVLSWEFWNEVDITTDYKTDPVRDWHARMAKGLRELDPYRHLITTSFARTGGDKAIDTLPELDYVQSHHYNSPDLAVTLANAQSNKAAYLKPHYVGEIGADSGGPRSADDPQGLQVHDPLWVTIATGGSGAAQSWWWDNLIHPRKLYPLYTSVSRFVADIDWPAEGIRSIAPRIEWPSGSSPSEGSKPPLLAWAIAGKNTSVAWVRVEGRTWRRVCGQKETVPAAPASVLLLPGLRNGPWHAQVWDTWTGAILQENGLEVGDSQAARINLPTIERDVAVKLRRSSR